MNGSHGGSQEIVLFGFVGFGSPLFDRCHRMRLYDRARNIESMPCPHDCGDLFLTNCRIGRSAAPRTEPPARRQLDRRPPYSCLVRAQTRVKFGRNPSRIEVLRDPARAVPALQQTVAPRLRPGGIVDISPVCKSLYNCIQVRLTGTVPTPFAHFAGKMVAQFAGAGGKPGHVRERNFFKTLRVKRGRFAAGSGTIADHSCHNGATLCNEWETLKHLCIGAIVLRRNNNHQRMRRNGRAASGFRLHT